MRQDHHWSGRHGHFTGFHAIYNEDGGIDHIARWGLAGVYRHAEARPRPILVIVRGIKVRATTLNKHSRISSTMPEY